MNTLFKIQEEYLDIINEVQQLDGELTPELEQALSLNEKELKGKSIAYLEVIKSAEAQNLAIDEEIKRLQAMKKRNNNLTTFLKAGLENAVKLFGDFTSGTHTFTTRKSQSLEVIDETKIPSKFLILKQTTQVDKVAIKNAIKMGEKVEGVELIEKKNLNIK